MILKQKASALQTGTVLLFKGYLRSVIVPAPTKRWNGSMTLSRASRAARSASAAQSHASVVGDAGAWEEEACISLYVRTSIYVAMRTGRDMEQAAIEQCCCPRLVILLPAGSIRWAALLVILFFFISKDSLKRCQVLFVKTKESKVKSLGKKQGNTKSRTGSKIFPFFIRGVIMIGNFFSLVRACL
jgi:hypothetical protein